MIQGLILLLVFTPLAFGTVEPWSIAAMELGAFSLFAALVATRGVALPSRPASRAVLVLFLLLTGLVLLQLLPLPDGALGRISPATAAIWRRFADDAPGAGRTLSLSPDATLQELLKLLAYAAVFVVVARRCRTRASLLLLVKTILFMGGLLAVLAVAQKLTWNGRILWFYPVEESLRSGRRIWGPYVNHNHFAGYLEMVIPLGLGLLVYLAPGGARPRGERWGGRLARLAASGKLAPLAGVSLLVLLLAACLVATLSRGAVAASACAWLFFLGLTWRRRSVRTKALRLAPVAAAFGAAILLPFWGRIEQRFADIEAKSQVSRLYVLEDSLGILRDFPLLGTGLGTFERGYLRYQTRYPNLFFDHAHNDYLEMATDTGAAGFLLAAGMAAIFFVSLIRGWRRRHNRFSTCIGAGGISSCLAIAVHSGADFNLHIPANALLFAVIAGLTHAAVFSPGVRDGTEPVPDAAPQRRLRALGAIPLAGLLLYLPGRALLADHDYRRVARLLDDRATAELDVKPIASDTMPDYLEAVEALQRAAAREPSRSAYPQALSDLHALTGEWATTMESLNAALPAGAPAGKEALARATEEARRAIALDPANPDLHLALARRLAAAGDFARADTQVQLALVAYPGSAPLRYEAAVLYLLEGRKESALEQARALARLDDSYLIAASEQKTYQAERRARPYLSRLKASYLFRALEIAWRASGDVGLVKGLAPANEDAQAVLAAFLEWKGLDD